MSVLTGGSVGGSGGVVVVGFWDEVLEVSR